MLSSSSIFLSFSFPLISSKMQKGGGAEHEADLADDLQ
jgi:hypothetical protein